MENSTTVERETADTNFDLLPISFVTELLDEDGDFVCTSNWSKSMKQSVLKFTMIITHINLLYDYLNEREQSLLCDYLYHHNYNGDVDQLELLSQQWQRQYGEIVKYTSIHII